MSMEEEVFRVIFNGITQEELRQIKELSCMRTEKFKKNDIILHMSDIISELGIVLEGSVNIENIDIWGNRSILSDVSCGHIFAETYALLKIPLMVDVTASADTVILFIDTDTIMKNENAQYSWYSKVQGNLLNISMHKNMLLLERIFCISSKGVRNRITTYLNSQSVKHKSLEFDIPFDRQQMADYLNIERSVLSKELGSMQSEGLISFRKNHFKIIKK